MAIWHAMSNKILIRIVAINENLKLTGLHNRYHTTPPPVGDVDKHIPYVCMPSRRHTWVFAVYSDLLSPWQLLGDFEPRPELCWCMPVSLLLFLCPPPSRQVHTVSILRRPRVCCGYCSLPPTVIARSLCSRIEQRLLSTKNEI